MSPSRTPSPAVTRALWSVSSPVRAFVGLVVLTGLAGLAVAASAVAPAAAQRIDDTGAIVQALRVDGYVVADGSSADVNAAEGLVATAPDGWYLVFSGPVSTSASVVADGLRRELTPATVLVVAELDDDPAASFDVGVASDDLDDTTIDSILDEAQRTLSAEPSAVGVAEAVVVAADRVDPSGSSGGTGDGSGGSGIMALVVVVGAVVVVGGVGFVLVRRSVRARDARDVDNARAEIEAQLAVVANEILENADRVELSGESDAVESYRLASAAYADVTDRIGATTDLIELAALNDRIDEARWRIEVAEALAEGREPPPEPVDDRAACFFDPTHRAGTETAVVREDGHERTVRVCRDCRERLDRGDPPEPRLVRVGSRRVPAAVAPRSHGGLGLGGLGVFDVLGAGTRLPHRWGGSVGRRGRVGGTGSPVRTPGAGGRRMGGGARGRGRRRF